MPLFFFFFYCYVAHRNLHSFPTRRSSDLTFQRPISISVISLRIAIIASQKRSSSALDSDSVGSIISVPATGKLMVGRSEEHTSELQSQFHLVCRLLLEKKNTADFCEKFYS